MRETSAIKECGLVLGASCPKGTRYTFLVLSAIPTFLAFAPSASFDEIDSTTGLFVRRVAFTAIVVGVSVMPLTIFASVLPVQGATSISSMPDFVIVSASTIVFMGVFPVFSTMY